MSEDADALLETTFARGDTLRRARSLTLERRATLRAFWLARATGELTTALSFEYMLADLRALGAPQVLQDLAEAALSDEHRHVDWCLRFARLLGDGQEAQAELDGTRPLVFDGASAADCRVLRTVFGCCFSETVAVHVLRASQRQLADEATARLNRQHLAEEVRHSRLGWGLLGWEGLNARGRAMLSEHVPFMANLTRALWLGGQRDGDSELEALGYLSNPLIEAAVTQAFDEVIFPGLERSGVRL